MHRQTEPPRRFDLCLEGFDFAPTLAEDEGVAPRELTVDRELPAQALHLVDPVLIGSLAVVPPVVHSTMRSRSIKATVLPLCSRR